MASVVEFAPTRGRSTSVQTARLSRDIDRRGAVARLVEREIIPRLLEARVTVALVDTEKRQAISADDVATTARLACAEDSGLFFDYVEKLLAKGFGPDTLFVDLFPSAARLLGGWWDDDERDFTEVTIGLWRLQEAVRFVADRVPPRCWPGPGARRALFAAMPDDPHGFGAILVSESFARAGWDTDLAIGEDVSALLARVARGSFDIVGLSVSSDGQLSKLASLIQSLRAVSRAQGLRIMVGGGIFVADPALARQLGADGTAADAEAALALADELVGQATERYASRA